MTAGTSGLRIGTAGWAIPRQNAVSFPTEGAGLERYAARFNAVEINSTFYRPHRASTFANWAAKTPADFRFAVKLPRTLSHDARLAIDPSDIAAFRSQLSPLLEKLAVVLVQLPPSLAFDPQVADRFFAEATAIFDGVAVACEPRHASWFAEDAEALLASRRITRVAADPARHPEQDEPGGWRGFEYHRLHGSPRMYRSAYGPDRLPSLANRLRAAPAGSWCIFDNTASGAAAQDALDLVDLLRASASNET